MVIEEFLEGPKKSASSCCATATRRLSLDPHRITSESSMAIEGPEPGGMGAYSDSRILTRSPSAIESSTRSSTVVGATGYTGFLYAGLMMTVDGPRVA